MSEWEPYVRIWHEVESDRDVAMLLADDYRQLCKVVRAAIEFVRCHERGQPGTPGTLYPMTYSDQLEWEKQWDERYDAMSDAVYSLKRT
jgi:hypothetical protein